jgi:uncharacterized protein YlxW (UPF0749 family)
VAKLNYYLPVMLVALVLGIILAMQFRVTNYPLEGVPINRDRELANELRELTREIKVMEEEIADLEYNLEQIQTGQAEVTDAMISEVAKTRLGAGLVSVTGPGVEVILNNPPHPDGRPGGSLFIIRDEDMLKVVNELRGSGAEAISINGQRLLSFSEVRLAGSFINVNLTRVVPPYQILAVGPADQMEESLLLPGGLAEFMQDVGIQVTVEKHDSLTVPAYKGDWSTVYAKPAQRG